MTASAFPLIPNPGRDWDVIVLGGGPSGSMAATVAAAFGAKTLLVEKAPFLGGSFTAMGVGPMMSSHNKAGRQLVLGLPQKLVSRLVTRGASPGHIPDSVTYCSTVTPFDSEALKEELEGMVIEQGGIHSPTGESTESIHMKDHIAYAIPLSSLLVASPNNVVFVGRGISATHEAAAAFRVTPIAMAIGQAGGTLAALSALDSDERPANAFPYELLRTRLLADGAFLG